MRDQMSMAKETESAAQFIATFIPAHISRGRRQKFIKRLQWNLTVQYYRHWYLNEPSRGQAFRCLLLTPRSSREPPISTALEAAGLTEDDIRLPLDLAVWVDPGEVAYRLGERGSQATLAVFEPFMAGSKSTSPRPVNVRRSKSASPPLVACVPSPAVRTPPPGFCAPPRTFRTPPPGFCAPPRTPPPNCCARPPAAFFPQTLVRAPHMALNYGPVTRIPTVDLNGMYGWTTVALPHVVQPHFPCLVRCPSGIALAPFC